LPDGAALGHIRVVERLLPPVVRNSLSATLLIVSTLACASTPVLEGPAPALLPPPPAKPLPPPGAPPGKLYREDVVSFVDAGFPGLLERMDVDAHVRNGKFVGWTLLALYPMDFWADIDLKPGDVVTSVNGMPIERDTEAYACFQSMKTAPRLSVRYLRAGAPRELVFEIVPRPAPGLARR